MRDTSALLEATALPALCLERRLWLLVGKESGHLHSRLRRSQWLQRGLSSSHLTFRRLPRWLVNGPLCVCGPAHHRRRGVFRVAYLHVRQPYLERAEDLLDERAGPPVEFGVPRSFSGLGDMFAAASLQCGHRRRGLAIGRVRVTRWSAHEAAARLDLTGS